jgi:cytoskeletal protein CcmA (bactofilin family)
MNQEITTILGKGSAFDGKLTFEGAVRIDGDFSGEIRTEGTLYVGESARVQAQITAARIVVQGTVRGDLVASDAIELHAPARVHGSLAAPTLEIQKGSWFEGTCRMEAATAPLATGNGRSVREAVSETVAEA